MVLKFHIQHDKAAGLLNDKKYPLLLKIAKALKSTFSPEPLDIFRRNFVKAIGCTLIVRIVKMKERKNYSRIRSQ